MCQKSLKRAGQFVIAGRQSAVVLYFIEKAFNEMALLCRFLCPIFVAFDGFSCWESPILRIVPSRVEEFDRYRKRDPPRLGFSLTPSGWLSISYPVTESWHWPPVSSKQGITQGINNRMNFVVNPPRERPIACWRPPLFCACSMLMDTDNRCINHDEFKVDFNRDMLEYSIPNAGELPATKPAVNGRP